MRDPLRLAAIAAALFALPALAGSWPNLPAKRAKTTAAAAVSTPMPLKEPRKDFEFGHGDIGSQPTQHSYVWSGGRLVHSDECDHVVRQAQAAPTGAEVDAARRLSPGS